MAASGVQRLVSRFVWLPSRTELRSVGAHGRNSKYSARKVNPTKFEIQKAEFELKA